MMSDELKRVKLLLLDVDGVLTDGGITYGDDGSETKVFDVKDGLGLRLLMDAGVRVGIVTGRRSGALTHRCRDLGIDLIFEGVADKVSVLEAILKQTHLRAHEVAFAGDDLPDLPLMKRVGVSIAVADASKIVIDQAVLVSTLANYLEWLLPSQSSALLDDI